MTETERFAWFPCWERDWTDERTGRTYTMKSPRGRALYERVGDYSWQRAAADPDKAARMRRPWDTRYPCWGLALPTGVVAIDCDIDHDDPSVTGWDMMQEMTGCVYGSAGIPRTVISRTPSGGAHLLYRVPDEVQLMDIVHQPVDGVTVPLDIRLGGRGYVIAPGSRTMAGRYRLVDVPDGDGLPMLTPALGGLLVRLGAVAGAGPRRPKAKPMIPTRIWPARGRVPSGMHGFNRTPMPKGTRNSTLAAQVWGWLVNDPQSIDTVRAGAIDRAIASGLPVAEAEGIVDRAARKLGIQ